jgi:hypothetical protein
VQIKEGKKISNKVSNEKQDQSGVGMKFLAIEAFVFYAKITGELQGK